MNKLKTEAANFPLEVFFLRDDDIPQYVEDGVADIGIVGENVVLEKNRPLRTVEKLGFGKCRLAMAVPKGMEYTSIRDLNGQRIATSYPALLSRWLADRGIDAKVVLLSGSVEIAPRLGQADAICDLVSSGATLAANQLKPVTTLLKAKPCSPARPRRWTPRATGRTVSSRL